MREVYDHNLDAALARAPQALIIYSAPWCAPCRTAAAMVRRLERKQGLHFVALYVDVEQNELAEERVQSLPTLDLYRYGERVQRWVGVSDGLRKSLVQALSEPLGPKPGPKGST